MTEIIHDFIPFGRRNRPGKANPREYITIHNTGNTAKGAGARNHAAYLKGAAAAEAPVSWHYTVDGGLIVRHLPDGETAYHAGDGANGTGNARSIGIEICMNSDGDLRKATDNAAGLTALLCKTHSIPLERVVQHNRWSGKDCPQMLRGGNPYNWDVFIGKVRDLLDTAAAPPPKPADTPSDWAEAACRKAVDKGLAQGDGTGYFGWREPVTMQKLMVLLDKLGVI